MKRRRKSPAIRNVRRAPVPRRLFVERLEDRLPPGDLLSLVSAAGLLSPHLGAVENALPTTAPQSRGGETPAATARPTGGFLPPPSDGAPFELFTPSGDEAKPFTLTAPDGAGEWHATPPDYGTDDDLLTQLASAAAARNANNAAGSTAPSSPGLPAAANGGSLASPSLDQATVEALAGALNAPPPPPASGPPSGLNVTIVADTDRDGAVSDADLPGRADYTSTRGAIFTINYDDDNSDGAPDAVNFADSGAPFNENRVIENAADAQDLAPLVIRALGPGFTPNLTVVLTAAELEDAQSVHVFPSLTPGTQAVLGGLGSRTGGAPAATSVDITSFVSATQDVTFGVEGMFFRNTNANPLNTFDGEIDLTLQVFDGSTLVSQDAVRMKVAPWIIQPHTQDTLQSYITNSPSNQPTLFTQVATQQFGPGYYGLDVTGPLDGTGVVTAVPGSLSNNNQWFQDHGEFGYTQRPGGQPMHVFFRLPYARPGLPPQPVWPQVLVLRPNVGTFQLGVNLGAGAGDYGGNIEVSAPTVARPRGQVIQGDTGSNALFNFFLSQEVQPAIQLPTRWLGVGHLDEIFLATTTPNHVVVADPQDAYNRLEAIPPGDDRGRAVLFATGRMPEVGTIASSSTPTRIFTGVDHRGQSWQFLRVYDSSASGSGAAGQVARVAPGGLGNGFIDIDAVWNTGSRVVHPTPQVAAGASAMRWLLYANPPGQGSWFVPPQAGDRFVLVEGTRSWSATGANAAPTIITAAEVLADDELRALNLIDYQGVIDGVRATLDNQAGGPGTLTFIKVPVLYVGIRNNFQTNRSASAFTPGLQNFMPLADEYYLPQQFGARVSSGSRSGELFFSTNDGDANPFSFTLSGGLNAGPLTVASLTPTGSGFVAEFSRPIDRGAVNLYDAQTSSLGPADVTLIGQANGPVQGSLAVDASGLRATFVRTGGVLPADSYTVTFRSAGDGFKDSAGGLLDGNNDGTTGDNYTFTFSATAPAVTVGVPDFMRGPGQPVNVPAGAAGGIPLRLSEAAGVTSVQMTLRYDPALLRLTAASVGSGLSGATVNLATNTPGVAVLSFHSATPLTSGAVTFATLTADVPTNAPYGFQHVLDVTGLSVNNGAIAARDDDAVHVVGYLGDTTGNGAYTSVDAQRALRAATGQDSGFGPYPTTDPVLVADATGNGTLNSLDATRILQESLGIDQAEIPSVPAIEPPSGADVQVLEGTSDVRGNGTVDFGNAALGATAARTFTVRNNGTAPLTLGPISVPYGFILVAGFGATTLAPGAQTTFTVRMLTDGIDIFEAAAVNLVPGTVRFVDVWNLYHRLLGELHCGMVTMRVPFSFNWWNNL